MEHQSSNKNKSKNGTAFEKEFTDATGITKIRKKDKPRFKNSHGLSLMVLWIKPIHRCDKCILMTRVSM